MSFDEKESSVQHAHPPTTIIITLSDGAEIACIPGCDCLHKLSLDPASWPSNVTDAATQITDKLSERCRDHRHVKAVVVSALPGSWFVVNVHALRLHQKVHFGATIKAVNRLVEPVPA